MRVGTGGEQGGVVAGEHRRAGGVDTWAVLARGEEGTFSCYVSSYIVYIAIPPTPRFCSG